MARVKRTEDVGNLGRRARGGSGSVSCTCEGEGRLDGLDQGSRGSQEGREREREREDRDGWESGASSGLAAGQLFQNEQVSDCHSVLWLPGRWLLS